MFDPNVDFVLLYYHYDTIVGLRTIARNSYTHSYMILKNFESVFD